jgi:hypothetical protein
MKIVLLHVPCVNGTKNATLGSFLDQKIKILVQKSGPNSNLVLTNWNRQEK